MYICVIVSTGSWRDRIWQVAARLTGEDVLVSVFTLVFWLLAFFPGIQQLALLLLKYLRGKGKVRRFNIYMNIQVKTFYSSQEKTFLTLHLLNSPFPEVDFCLEEHNI